MQSCAAMEIIPHLVPGKVRSILASRYFLDVKEDTASMAEAIKKPKRLYPYILQIGDSFTIIARGKPFMSAQNSADALLNLFCLHYVFNTQNSPEVKPSFLLIQSEVMGLKDSDTASCKNLAIFLKHLELYRKDEVLSESDSDHSIFNESS